jgi:hypothetical protein
MGAEHAAYIIRGTSAKDAYDRAFDEARWEHGNGGYTGTIAESHGFKTTKPRLRYEAEKAADALLADKMVDGLTVRKWEYAALIPILPDAEARTIIIPVDVTDCPQRDPQAWREPDPMRVMAEQAVTAKLKQGEHIMKLEVHTGGWRKDYLDKYGTDEQKKITSLIRRKNRTEVRRTEGERGTRYAVTSGSNSRSTVYGVFRTLDEAKAHAASLAERDGPKAQVGIVQWTVREGSDNGFLYQASTEVTKRVVAVKAVIGKRRVGNPEEFMAVGVYSS